MIQTLLRFLPRVLAILVMGGVTLEICARLDDYFYEGADPGANYAIANLFDFDSLGQKGRPGARFGKWRMNSLGFRGPEPEPGRHLILAVGSSETFGQYESEGHEWPRQLQTILDQQYPKRFAVLNTALAGESFPTSVKRLPEHLARLHPTAVLFYPSLAHYLHVPYLSPTPAPPPPQRFVFRIAGRAETLLKASLPESLQTLLRKWQTERASKNYPVAVHDMPPELQQRFAEDIARAVEFVRLAGATPLFITHANRFGPAVSAAERPVLIAWRRFYPMLAEDGFLPMEQSMNDVLRRTVHRLDAPLIDVSPRVPFGPKYFADFVHFTDEGSRVFASLVIPELQKCISDTGFTCPSRSPAEKVGFQ